MQKILSDQIVVFCGKSKGMRSLSQIIVDDCDRNKVQVEAESSTSKKKAIDDPKQYMYT